MDSVSISISQLKTNPARAISMAEDYPMTIKNRNQTKAYLLGKDIYEKIISLLEDFVDKKAASEADFTKGKDFEKLAQELNI